MSNSVGYAMAIIVDGRPILYWKEWNGDAAEDKRGQWVKSASHATRSYSRESMLEKYDNDMRGGHTPCTDIVVIEDRLITSVMTELAYESRRVRRLRVQDAD